MLLKPHMGLFLLEGGMRGKGRMDDLTTQEPQ
jgi:hypothetical protein|nr:MAG TPA: hypothetical protein [Caudoviricetes sp.]